VRALKTAFKATTLEEAKDRCEALRTLPDRPAMAYLDLPQGWTLVEA
jgi:hypothetical protein